MIDDRIPQKPFYTLRIPVRWLPMIEQVLQQECDLQFFHENDYVRKQCSSCKSYFWTTNKEDTLCGDRPCVPFSFIDKPLTKKPWSIDEVRKAFISYFNDNAHEQVTYPDTGNRCPVIARWRNDIYLTIASIADFQPHVTSGDVPPPHNPLVISQPCIRLNDLENVGKSGRHLTMFEMMGHHAFNKNKDEIYWKEKTIAYCDEFFTKIIGIPREKVTYKEQLWIGGGNAGPCIEVLAAGLEIATLVFMNLQEQPKGSIEIDGIHYTQNPLNIVDTGYGLERIAWVSQGSPTVYETVFPDIINWIKQRCTPQADQSSIYALADHSKCLAFMLGDGIVPSNVKAGYLARLLIRRSLRFVQSLNLQVDLKQLVTMQLETLEKTFPSLTQDIDKIQDLLDVETQRYNDTITKGKQLITRLLKEKKQLTDDDLVMLYDTHGMPPSMVQSIAKRQGITISIPENFESMIAELHSQEKKTEKEIDQVEQLPCSIPLYYQDHYLKECDSTVLWSQQKSGSTECILDQTVCYPEGGGQPGDIGTLEVNGKKVMISEVKKHGSSIIHVINGQVNTGDIVHVSIDWDHRYTLMKHHTGTHLVNGALRTVLGNHVWQAGSQLELANARFDFTHYQPLTPEEITKIEQLANAFIAQKVPVEKKCMKRNDAERTYGFRLYQGGVPPGNDIRVLDISGVDVEACGGTHVNNTVEIEKIKILKTERIQDGVNRIVFAAGKMVDAYHEEEQSSYDALVSCLASQYTIENHEQVSEQLEQAQQVFSVPLEQLEKTLQRFLKETDLKGKTAVESFSDACQHLFEQWKETQKKKKQVSMDEIEQLRDTAEKIKGSKIQIITANVQTESTSTAGKLIAQPGFVVHIFDGKKLTSAASEDVDIDLRKIAPELGKILGGSGGGKPRLTQSGGPNTQNIEQVFARAKELTIKALN